MMTSYKIRHALIMAAGRGTRMIPLTNSIPKAMAELDGNTLIANGISKLKHEIESIHITVGYKGSMLAKHVIENDVSSVINTEGKNNAWWLFNSLLVHLDEPILVLTCDNVTELDIKLITEDYYKFGEPACMLIPVKPIEGLEGDFISQINHKVSQLSRTKRTDIYCSGIQVLNPKKINSIVTKSDDFNEVWSQLIEQNELVSSRIYPKNWFTFDTLEQLHNYKKNGK